MQQRTGDDFISRTPATHVRLHNQQQSFRPRTVTTAATTAAANDISMKNSSHSYPCSCSFLLLLSTYFLLPNTYYLIPTIGYLPATHSHYLLPDTCCLQHAACCILPVATAYSLLHIRCFPADYLLLAIYNLILATYCRLATSWHLLPPNPYPLLSTPFWVF